MSRLRLTPSVALLVGAVVVAASTAAYAAAGSSGKIRACVNHKGGGLYLAGRCARHDRRLVWNVSTAGPAGGVLAGSYPNPGLARGVVTDANVRPGSLTGTSINSSTLGKVPSAGSADTAATAGSANSAVTASSPSTLAHGKTLRGVFEVSASGPGVFGNAYSFAFPLSSSVGAVFVPSGSGPTPACPGSVSDPQALPGFLCLYSVFPSGPSVQVDNPQTNFSGSAGQFGFTLVITPATSGDHIQRGTWAVTAP